LITQHQFLLLAKQFFFPRIATSRRPTRIIVYCTVHAVSITVDINTGELAKLG